MSRTTIVALAAAAVIGTTGGVTLALSAAGDNGGTPSAERSRTTRGPSSTPTDSGTDSKPDSENDSKPKGDGKAVPLYYADGAIHDGATNVAVPTEVAAGEVRELEAVDGGWLVVQSTTDSSGDEFFTGTFVPESGAAWRIGEWRGNWDITAERDQVVYGNGVTWHTATFASRTTAPLDILTGAGKEPPYMHIDSSVGGIAIADGGLITAWKDGGANRLLLTDENTWTHQPWGPRRSALDGPVLPDVLTSPDGSQAVVAYGNVDYRPDNPVGACLAGGAVDDVSNWWQECAIGAASLEPWSPDGDGLLVIGTSGDGPGTSWVRVIDPRTGTTTSEFDPTGLMEGAEWGDGSTVFTLTYDEQARSALIKRCDVATATCTLEKRAPDNAVLGSR